MESPKKPKIRRKKKKVQVESESSSEEEEQKVQHRKKKIRPKTISSNTSLPAPTAPNGAPKRLHAPGQKPHQTDRTQVDAFQLEEPKPEPPQAKDDTFNWASFEQPQAQPQPASSWATFDTQPGAQPDAQPVAP